VGFVAERGHKVIVVVIVSAQQEIVAQNVYCVDPEIHSCVVEYEEAE
jgi:hypothetical protein